MPGNINRFNSLVLSVLTHCFTVAFIYKMHENKGIQMITR